jgi:hypothetical protein
LQLTLFRIYLTIMDLKQMSPTLQFTVLALRALSNYRTVIELDFSNGKSPSLA